MTSTTLPNGPATLATDLRKDKFKLEYAGATILQGSLRLERDEAVLSLKEGGSRLLAISRSEGWDRVTQVIRITAVALRPSDRLLLKLTVPSSPPDPDGADAPKPLQCEGASVTCPVRDFKISVEPESAIAWIAGEKATAEGSASEFTLTFRPLFSRFHQ